MHRIPSLALVVAAALAAASAPSFAQKQPAASPRTARVLRTSADLVAALGGNIRRLPAVLQSAEVESSLRRICAVSTPERVTCSSLDQIADVLRLQPGDEKLMRLGLNDLMSTLGLPGTDQTLFMCMGQGPTITPAQFGSTAGGGGLQAPSQLTASARRSPSTFTAGQSFSAATQAPSMAERGAMSQRCGANARTSGMFGAGSATDRNYQRAVSAAVAVMDRAMAQCRTSGTSPVAEDAGGTAAPPAGEKPKEEPPKSTTEQVMNNLTTWLNVVKGSAELILAVHDGNLPGAVLAVAELSGDADAIAADGTATGETNEVVQATAKTASVASLLVTAGTEGATVMAAGTAVSAVLPVMATLAVVVPATRWADEKTGFGDWAVNKLVSRNENSAEYKDQYGIKSGTAPGTTDKLSCAEMKQAWERFRAYCSQPGNNWQTYDCAKFVARMNRCADPAVVNPGSNGDYVCRARAGERDKAIAQCEVQRKKQDMIARRIGDVRRPSCATSVDQWASARANATAIFRERQCTKANPGDDGAICPGAAPAGSGGGGAPAPKPASHSGSGA